MMAVPSPHLGDLDEDAVFEAAAGFFTAGSPEPMDLELPAGTTPREAVAELIRSMMSQKLGADFADKSTAEVIDGAQYFVFPNWCPWSGLSNALQYRFRPNGDDPHSSIFEVRMMGFSEIMDQDEANLKAIQRGLRATVRTGVPFAEHQESRIRHFHALLDEYLE